MNQCGLCKHSTADGAGKLVLSGFLVCKKHRRHAGDTVSSVFQRDCRDYEAETDEEKLKARVRFMGSND